MRVLDVINAPWAVSRPVFDQIQAIYAARVASGPLDLETLEARAGQPLRNAQARYSVENGVAIVPLEGVLGKKMNMLSAMSGGSSTQLVASDLAAAAADPSVHSIILDVDSPGGTVDGTQDLAAAVRAAAAAKPTYALASGVMCSAAYWAASAAGAGHVFMADDTTEVGSIGVVATHVDISGAEAQKGIKTTEVTAGRYKRQFSAHKPLDAEGLQAIQADVDHVYSLFVDAVAEHRGVSVDQVLEQMADGKVFRGKKAIAAGLVDGVTTLPALIDKLNADRSKAIGNTRSSSSTRATGAAAMPQTKDQILAESPEAARELIAQGAEQERTRIQGVENACLPGHEALIAGLKFDGKTSPGDAALAVMAAERKSRTAAATALAEDAPAVVRTPATPTNDATKAAGAEAGTKSREAMAAEAATLAAKKGISFAAAFRELGFDYVPHASAAR